ncbi:MAG: Type I signal peptidase [Microgenomates group bacterium GW2011_GWA2_40_6]|nr:MAG: Type I signal peptidase [Microgenomates group bacterium GW2011_GWA2_40_6]
MEKFKKSKIKIFFDVIYGVIFVALIFIAGLVALSALNIPRGLRLYTVQSGSMMPTLPIGSLIISQSQKEYQAGDIITFKSEKDIFVKNPKDTTTHRLVEIKNDKNLISYITKGDANNTPDANTLSPDLVLGKTVFSFPFLGFPVAFGRTQTGLIVMIVIPATLIIYSELLNIKKEIIKLIAQRKKAKNEIKIS